MGHSHGQNSPRSIRLLAAVIAAAAGLLVCTPALLGGPYAPGVGQPGSTAIPAADPNLVLWASAVGEIRRGPQGIFDPEAYGDADFGLPANALGRADVAISDADQQTFSVVSLGDGGSITLGFSSPFGNGPGADLAVFENSFSDTFLELAFVEVSSDGVHFTRFPSVSLTPVPQGGDDLSRDDFSTIDPTNINNLAGKYRGGFGTPFDLSQLAGTAGLDINHIVAVRIVDVVGSSDPRWATHDSLGNIVKDPFPTVFPSGGFDLDAVGAYYPVLVPEPSSASLLLFGSAFFLYRRRR